MISITCFNQARAERLAFNFLLEEWFLSAAEQDWLTVLTVQPVGVRGYRVEIGLEGLPDRWIIEVLDTGECDPNYTFASPLSGCEFQDDLANLPYRLAQMVAAERNSWLILQEQAS